MTAQKDQQHLAEVKTALAAKYERRSRACNSRNSKARLERQAAKYRRQAADLLKQGS